jgi:hypothetical protein
VASMICQALSYGNEPRRHVDLFRTDTTAFPSLRMSDAILADAEQQRAGAASGSGPGGSSGLASGDAGLPPAGGRAARLGRAVQVESRLTPAWTRVDGAWS